MATICGTRVYVDSNKLILEAVFTDRLTSLFFSFALLLKFLFSEQIFFVLFLCLILFWYLCSLLKSVFLTHNLEVGIGFEIKHGWECTQGINLVSLKSLKIETNTL